MMVALTFPDGARREYPNGITGFDIAKGISPSLAKRTVAMALDGTLADLSDKIEKKMREIIARDKPFSKEVWSRDEAKRIFKDKGELFKVELVDAIPKDQ